jgi:hypothetical protein
MKIGKHIRYILYAVVFVSALAVCMSSGTEFFRTAKDAGRECGPSRYNEIGFCYLRSPALRPLIDSLFRDVKVTAGEYDSIIRAASSRGRYSFSPEDRRIVSKISLLLIQRSKLAEPEAVDSFLLHDGHVYRMVPGSPE